MMLLQDARGLALTGAGAAERDAYETALHQFNCYIGDPAATISAALAERPDFAMGQAMKAYLFLTSTEAAALPVARDCLAALNKVLLNERERAHAAVVETLLEGRMEAAQQKLEAILLTWPRDMLALQIAHLFDFFLGDARNLRDRVARRLHAWSPQDANWHALLGMHAFGLEEMGQYEQAEEKGRAAVELQRRDGWAWHAVAHVTEMQNRPDEGIAWLSPNSQHWGPDSIFDVHNWWHLALFHLEQDDTQRVLELYDGPIRQDRSAMTLDIIDASAMLWRLMLRGVPVGQARWDEIADAWAPFVEDGVYAFNDVHGLMAFVGAGRQDLIDRQLVTLKRAAAGKGIMGEGSNQAMARQVGLPVAEALIAFGRGKHAVAIEKLQHIRPIANRFGGSHAQRDVIDLTLIEAAKRSGHRELLSALAGERAAARPRSPLARRYAEAA
jgi:tetratricopeptide (TPR) repeat protein